MSRPRLAQRAFTLLETVVVIGIIAVLMGILLPVVSAVRRSMKVTQCASNLRSIAQALHTYHAEHHGWPFARPMPVPYWPVAFSASMPPLYDVLDSYVGATSRIFRCPGDEGQVFDRSATAYESRGTSYVYTYPLFSHEVQEKLESNWKGIMMYDCGIDEKDAAIHPQLHRRGSVNILGFDGSVVFERGKLSE